eukprot:356909-Chlamydomonas_euryale.AAC.4
MHELARFWLAQANVLLGASGREDASLQLGQGYLDRNLPEMEIQPLSCLWGRPKSARSQLGTLCNDPLAGMMDAFASCMHG